MKKTKNIPVPIQNPATEPIMEEPEMEPEKIKMTRKKITYETILTGFDELIKQVEDDIQKFRQTQKSTKGIKPFNELLKKLKILKNNTARIIIPKKFRVKRTNRNHGFGKPVKLSNELLQFTGWKDDEVHSRVDVTRFLCNYIKQNNLQEPKDKRVICVDKDKNLKTLFKSNSNEKITFASMQKYLKNHYNK